MAIDSRQERFVMNMRLRQRFARAKLFRVKKKPPDFVWLILIFKKSEVR